MYFLFTKPTFQQKLNKQIYVDNSVNKNFLQELEKNTCLTLKFFTFWGNHLSLASDFYTPRAHPSP